VLLLLGSNKFFLRVVDQGHLRWFLRIFDARASLAWFIWCRWTR